MTAVGAGERADQCGHACFTSNPQVSADLVGLLIPGGQLPDELGRLPVVLTVLIHGYGSIRLLCFLR
ncbi:MAG: hypothetical protein GVY09_20370 [Gammaproteobacteria bacterium]|jgi:hypothetical protein|nr:hypothetical protein [Gammaproteobacteria bacterium]